MLSFEPSRPFDLPLIRALLAENGLPTADLDTAQNLSFIVALQDGKLCGVGGLQVLGTVGLLRSCAIMPHHRGQGVGSTLVQAVEAAAVAHGVRQLYLLTTTAAPFFVQRGYRACERDTAPVELRATAEFAALCPSSSACLTKPLGGYFQ